MPHTDHIHFSFSWDGAYARTSWWTGKALTTVSPGPASAPTPTTPPQTPSAVYSLLIAARAQCNRNERLRLTPLEEC